LYSALHITLIIMFTNVVRFCEYLHSDVCTNGENIYATIGLKPDNIIYTQRALIVEQNI